jgi:branched-chain amino acid aminotransferase
MSVYINGDILPQDKAGLNVFDRGLLYGDGLYETIRVRNGRCLRFDSHAARMADGAAVLAIPLDIARLESAIDSLLQANHLSDARVRATLTRGAAPIGDPTLIITAVPLPHHGLDPTAVITSSYRRDETSPLTRVKSLNCLASVMAGFEAHARGADDAVLLNTRGNLAEATTANVFVVKGRRLMTPALDQGCLPGTVRAEVLALAPELGLDPIECEIGVDGLRSADEVFLTSAIRLARPIVELDGKVVGSGRHEVCARVREALLRNE